MPQEDGEPDEVRPATIKVQAGSFECQLELWDFGDGESLSIYRSEKVPYDGIVKIVETFSDSLF